MMWITAIVAAALMEPWARFAHRVLWHGPLESIHDSHHNPTGFWEANDLFAFVHAVPAIVLIVVGCETEGVLATMALGAGLGMTAFGAAYAIVHDGYIHGRLPVGFLDRFRWLRRIKAAHKAHHIQGLAPYGLFLGPAELRSHARSVSARRQAARAVER